MSNNNMADRFNTAARNSGHGDSGDGFGGGMAQALNHGDIRTLDDRKNIS